LKGRNPSKIFQKSKPWLALKGLVFASNLPANLNVADQVRFTVAVRIAMLGQFIPRN
jgi:hypothetical protein